MLGAHAKWKVCWIAKKKGKRVIIDHECGSDLNEAMRVYTLAKRAEKKMATLVCKNVGFPPPEKYMPKLVTKKKVVDGKKRKVTVRVYPMKVINKRGITWCPYCREFRKFQLQEAFKIDGIRVPDKGMHCPICGISHRNYLVRRYNPEMEYMYYRLEGGKT